METLQQKKLKDSLQKQMEELNMLTSIFCNPGELHIDDYSIIADINEFLDGRQKSLNCKLDYQINLSVADQKIEIRIELPHMYPSETEMANIIVRSPEIGKIQESQIGAKIRQYISETVDKNEPYIYEIVTWIQDNFEDFLISENVDHRIQENAKGLEDEEINSKIMMERCWIYSHHIKSKTKRRNIIKNAKDLDLSGFLRPGKPGIICVEGLQENSQEFWRLLKSMNWHKIQIKVTECMSKNLDYLSKFRRFQGFHEELFTDIDGDLDEEVPMNMSLFIKFLEKHHSGYIKKELFGFDW